MIRLGILVLSSALLFAQEYGKLGYEGTLHYEHETSKGHTVDLKPPLKDLVLNDETQQRSLFYSIVNYTLQSSDSHWALNVEGRANIQLSEHAYTTPLYVEKFAYEESKTTMLSAASVEYYGDNFALSLGRSVVDMDWLSGSIDAVMAYGITDVIEARAFWFADYYDYQYNYYSEYTDINDGKGIGGLYLQSGEVLEKLQLFAYYYLMDNRRYIAGARVHKDLAPFGLNASYTYSGVLEDAEPGNEEFWRIWGDVAVDDHHWFEMGYSQTGENGLTAMLRLGSHPFSQFYLTNALDRPRAKNGYAAYGYEGENLFFECVGGVTSYYGTTLQSPRLVSQWMRSREVDFTVGYAFNEHLLVEVGYMMLDLDQEDNLEFEQNLFMSTLVVQWP